MGTPRPLVQQNGFLHGGPHRRFDLGDFGTQLCKLLGVGCVHRHARGPVWVIASHACCRKTSVAPLRMPAVITGERSARVLSINSHESASGR